ncbi:pentapeptide repeat-containing protein [Amycolatopsis alba]|nr:pentapeptide repeat-containing protein [Amycolatopsis alba]
MSGAKTALGRRWRDRGGTWWWAIVVIVVPVALIAAAAVTTLLLLVDPGSDEKNKIELIKVGLTVGAGTGGVVALVLTGRRQWSTEHDNAERRLTELYVKAVEQLGSDSPAVRHGGLYALERVAQDNPDHRQVVVDVICAYLRAPFELPGAPRPRNRPGIHRPLAPGRGASRQRAASRDESEPPRVAELDSDARQEREVRLTAQRILLTHLRPGVPESKHPAKTFWKDIDLDLTGATLIDFDLAGCRISQAVFGRTTFTGGAVFDGATFADAVFDGATFTSDSDFDGATFTGGAWFDRATFTDEAAFGGVTFAGVASFDGVTFADVADFDRAIFISVAVFDKATFTDDAVFDRVTFTHRATFNKTTFDAGFAASGARIRVDPKNPDFEGSSWPHGWTVELPRDAKQVWAQLMPRTGRSHATGEAAAGQAVEHDITR